MGFFSDFRSTFSFTTTSPSLLLQERAGLYKSLAANSRNLAEAIAAEVADASDADKAEAKAMVAAILAGAEEEALGLEEEASACTLEASAMILAREAEREAAAKATQDAFWTNEDGTEKVPFWSWGKKEETASAS